MRRRRHRGRGGGGSAVALPVAPSPAQAARSMQVTSAGARVERRHRIEVIRFSFVIGLCSAGPHIPPPGRQTPITQLLGAMQSAAVWQGKAHLPAVRVAVMQPAGRVALTGQREQARGRHRSRRGRRRRGRGSGRGRRVRRGGLRRVGGLRGIPGSRSRRGRRGVRRSGVRLRGRGRIPRRRIRPGRVTGRRVACGVVRIRLRPVARADTRRTSPWAPWAASRGDCWRTRRPDRWPLPER